MAEWPQHAAAGEASDCKSHTLTSFPSSSVAVMASTVADACSVPSLRTRIRLLTCTARSIPSQRLTLVLSHRWSDLLGAFPFVLSDDRPHLAPFYATRSLTRWRLGLFRLLNAICSTDAAQPCALWITRCVVLRDVGRSDHSGSIHKVSFGRVRRPCSGV